MASENCYDAFIAQLERKHQVEPPGHESYDDVFNQAARLVGHLKKGLFTSIHRERQSEIRVAAQSWQDACYNDQPGSGVDILDWQPRYAQRGPPDAPRTSNTATTDNGRTSTQPAASGGTRHRSKSSPPGRKHPATGARAGGGGGNITATVASVTYEDGAAVKSHPPHHQPTAATGATANGVGAKGGSGASFSLRPGWSRQGPSAATPSPAGAIASAAAGAPARSHPDAEAHVGPANTGRRRSTDINTQLGGGKPGQHTGTSAGSGMGLGRGQGQAAPVAEAGGGWRREEDGSAAAVPPPLPPRGSGGSASCSSGTGGQGPTGDGDSSGAEHMPELAPTLTLRERRLASVSQPSRLLLQLEDPASSPAPGGTAVCPIRGARSGSLADEAIRVFAQTAYEPGEQRHSLLSPALLPGGVDRGDPRDARGQPPLALAPVPRAVPRHVTEAASALWAAGWGPGAVASPRASVGFTSAEVPGSSGGRRGAGSTSDQVPCSTAFPALLPTASPPSAHPVLQRSSYPDGHHPSTQSPPACLQPRQPEDSPPSSTPPTHGATGSLSGPRGRLTPSSLSAPMPLAGPPTPTTGRIAAYASTTTGHLVSLPGEIASQALTRAARRSSVTDFWGPDTSAACAAVQTGPAACGGRAGGGGASAGCSPDVAPRMRHSASGIISSLPLAVSEPPVARAPRESGGSFMLGAFGGTSGAAAAAAALAVPGSPSRAAGGVGLSAEAGTSGSGSAGAGPAGGGMIRGYFGGGPLDHRMLDVVPRLGLDAPRVKPQGSGGAGGAAAAGGTRGARISGTGVPAGSVTAATAPVPYDSHVELRKGLLAAPPGLEQSLRPPPRPATAQQLGIGGSRGDSAGEWPSAPSSSGRFARARRSSYCAVDATTTTTITPGGVPGVARSGGSLTFGRPAGTTGSGAVSPSGPSFTSGMMITREQVDSYMGAAAQANGRLRAGVPGASSGSTAGVNGGSRPAGHNVIGTRGCLTDERAGMAVRALRREDAAGGVGPRVW